MSAHKSFRNLMLLSCAAGALVLLAIASPVLIGWWLERRWDETSAKNSLLACLFLPTRADWPAHILSYALSAVAFFGLLLGAVSMLGQVYRTRRMVKALYDLPRPAGGPRWEQLLATLELVGLVDLIETDKPIAFCHGWRRPRICVSTGVGARLNDRELKALLLHERYHLRQNDPLKTAVSRALGSTFFFLPIVRALQRQYAVEKEIEADVHVLDSQGSNRPLLGALYKLLLYQTHPQPREHGRLAVVGAIDEVNQRLDYLLNGRAPSSLGLPVLFAGSATIAAISTIIALATWASAASALWQQAHAGLGGC